MPEQRHTSELSVGGIGRERIPPEGSGTVCTEPTFPATGLFIF